MKTIPNRRPRTVKYPANPDIPDDPPDITHARREIIRDNSDKSMSWLKDITGLSEYVINLIIELDERGQYDGYGYNQRVDKLSDDMQRYIRNLPLEISWAEVQRRFNSRFEEAEITPLGFKTIKRYAKIIQVERRKAKLLKSTGGERCWISSVN